MLLSATLHNVIGAGITATVLVLSLVRHIVRLAFVIAVAVTTGDPRNINPRNPLPPALESLLRHLPIDPRTASSKYHLLPSIITYAACPRCCCLYKPLPPGSPKPYADRCTFTPLGGQVCNTSLLKSTLVGDRVVWQAIRRFPYQDPSGFIERLVTRPQVEDMLDGPMGLLEERRTDIWQAEYFANFLGPDKLPFFTGYGRLAFALAVDWFNPYTNKEAQKKWSIGAIYLICLNLPWYLRFKIENVCVVGIIPGPHEPSLDQANHFINPVVTSFEEMWNPGIWIASTPRHPLGRLYRAVIALILADMIGARQIAGFTYPGHTFFCSYCLLPRDRIDDFDVQSWPKRDLGVHRRRVREWKDAATLAERDLITKLNGIRWSDWELLVYYNPFLTVVLDPLHLWHALLKKHGRTAWRMDVKLEVLDESLDPFYSSPNIMVMAKAEHAMLTKAKSEIDFRVAILVELCLRRGIRTGGKTKPRLLRELHEWVRSFSCHRRSDVLTKPFLQRISRGIIDAQGRVSPEFQGIPFQPPSAEEVRKSLEIEVDEGVIASAYSAVYNRAIQPTAVKNKVNAPALRALCLRANLDAIVETKMIMIERLVCGVIVSQPFRPSRFFLCVSRDLAGTSQHSISRVDSAFWKCSYHHLFARPGN